MYDWKAQTSQSTLHSVPLNFPPICAAVHPTQELIALGMEVSGLVLSYHFFSWCVAKGVEVSGVEPQCLRMHLLSLRKFPVCCSVKSLVPGGVQGEARLCQAESQALECVAFYCSSLRVFNTCCRALHGSFYIHMLRGRCVRKKRASEAIQVLVSGYIYTTAHS